MIIMQIATQTAFRCVRRLHIVVLVIGLTALSGMSVRADSRLHAVETGGFEGNWITNFGTLVLTQSDAGFSGKLTDAGNPKATGLVTGTLTGERLSGTWSLGERTGRFSSLTLGSDGETFTGSATSYTTWCGARKGKPLPNGCGFSGQWTIELNGAGTGTATLVQTGSTVSGSYSTRLASGRLTGSVRYARNGLPVLSGKWSSARSGGLFEAYLTGFDARWFQGNFDGKLAFCGWRSNVTKPETCLKRDA